MKVIKESLEFEWDKGNIGKNQKHKVGDKEAEEIFFNGEKFTFKDKVHSQGEERFRVLGKTRGERLLFVVFTKRGRKIRIISARNINKKAPFVETTEGQGGFIMKKPLKIPKFKNEDEERKFWWDLDLSEYFETSDFERVSFPNLKPTTKPISIRIPEYLLNLVKEKANEINIPYQSLIKEYIKKGVLSSV